MKTTLKLGLLFALLLVGLFVPSLAAADIQVDGIRIDENKLFNCPDTRLQFSTAIRNTGVNDSVVASAVFVESTQGAVSQKVAFDTFTVPGTENTECSGSGCTQIQDVDVPVRDLRFIPVAEEPVQLTVLAFQDSDGDGLLDQNETVFDRESRIIEFQDCNAASDTEDICEDIGDLRVKIIDLSDQLLETGDTLEALVDIENLKDNNLNNVDIEAWVEDREGDQILFERIENVDLFFEESEEIVFQFEVPENIEDGEHRLFIKAQRGANCDTDSERLQIDRVQQPRQVIVQQPQEDDKDKEEEKPSVKPSEGKVTLQALEGTQTIPAQRVSLYTISVSNPTDMAKTVTLTAVGAQDWAQVSIDPAIVVVGPKSSTQAVVAITPNSGVVGSKSLTVNAKEDGLVVAQTGLLANVRTVTEAPQAQPANWLNVLLFILAGIGVAAIVYAIFRYVDSQREGEDEDYGLEEEEEMMPKEDKGKKGRGGSKHQIFYYYPEY